jgi:hypothetical protein
MSVSFYNFFSLKKNFNREQLEDSYHNKVNNLRRLNINNNLDIQLYLDKIYRLYLEARDELNNRPKNYNQFGLIDFDNRIGLTDYMWDTMDYFNNIERDINKTMENFYKRTDDNTNLYGVSRNYSETMLSDGSRLVIQKNSVNKNGKIEETTHSYKKLKDGTIQPIKYDKARELIKN